MRIQPSKIPQDGLRICLQENLEVEGLKVDGPVRVALAVRKVGNSILLEGSLECEVDLECAACLDAVRTSVTSAFTADYRPVPKQPVEGEVELAEAELDVSYFHGDEIDLRDLLREQVVLGIPLRPLCREDCRGLCPVCGGNRNRSDCGCASEGSDPRFRALQKLKGEGHGKSNK